MFPQARSVGAWVSGGWHVTVGYLIGFAVLLGTLGWHPDTSIPPGASVALPAAPHPRNESKP